MKKFLLFLLFLVILFFSNAFSLTINAPGEIPSQINWTFSIELDSAEQFDETRVFIDNSRVLTAYSNGKTQLDAFNGTFVLDAFVFDKDPSSNSGLVLYVSYFGLSSGEHKIEAFSFKAGEQKADDSITFKAFNAAQKETVEELEGDKKNLRNEVLFNSSEVNKIKETLNQLTASLNSLNESTENESKARIEVEKQIESLKTRINNVNLENEKLELKNNELSKENEELKNQNIFSGLASLIGLSTGENNEAGTTNLITPLIFIFAVIVIAAVALNREKIFSAIGEIPKKRKTEIYSEETDEPLNLERDVNNFLDEQVKKKKKWGFSKEKNSSEEEEVNIGDLVKKD